MRKHSTLILLVFNLILLFMSWLMSFYAYPRLPQKIPLWLNCCGQPVYLVDKSPVFFIYPFIHTLFFLGFLLLTGVFPKREKLHQNNRIYHEYVYLALIFFSLIFIHITRSIIFLAHNIGDGVNKFYFVALFVVLLALIPYFRFRNKIKL